MKKFSHRHEIEAAADMLLSAGLFRTDCFASPLTAGEVLEVVRERTDLETVHAGDGWHAVMSDATVAAVTLRRIAALFGRLPYADLSKAVVKAFGHEIRGADDLYEAAPSTAVLRILLDRLDCPNDERAADLAAMPVTVPPSEMEVRLFDALATTLDGCMSSCRLVRRIGKSGKRTWFMDRFLPSVPFALQERLGPVRLLGHRPRPELHRPQEQGAFVGYVSSSCGRRGMVEYRVSEEAVETASFNVAAAVKILVAGEYLEVLSGEKVSFRLETKNTRKMAGVGRIIRKRFPDYVSGQRAYVVLDRETGLAMLEVCDAMDGDARARMIRVLEEGVTEKAAA